MRKFFARKKFIIQSLLLILIISNFSITFAYWASQISGSQVISEPQVQIGQWDFEDTALVVATFRSDYAYVLSLDVETVEVSDKAQIEAALAAYGLLSEEAKAELSTEQDLLISLLNEIIAVENSVFLDFEANPFDQGLTGTLDIEGTTWYANDVFISNDPTYDVWNDTRSLALRSTAYFESRDLFINGIDKIIIYHGALNYNNGASFQFRIEYELATNPGVWVILQEGGTDLLIDVISATPLTYTEIDVNITQALNIRFTPVISNTTDYINLDDIRIYEHVVSSTLEVTTFTTVYASALALDVLSVEISDKAAVEAALAAYVLLSIDAQNELLTQKALLDSLLVEIELQEDIQAATNLVVIAETTYVQADKDQAQTFVSALPNSTEKTALQARLDDVQDVIDAVALFLSDNQSALALEVSTVQTSDQAIVDQALSDYNLLSTEAKTVLAAEKALLDSLLVEINNQIPTATQVATFLSDHSGVLALNVGTVQISDQAAAEAALSAYDVLSAAAKAELTAEKALLDSLLVVIMDQIEAAAVDDLILALPVSGAITLDDETQIEAARTAYIALTASQESYVLNEAILISAENDLLALQTATDAVVIAENTSSQMDVDEAQALVTALPNGAAKTALQNRLNAVQDDIDVELARGIILNYFGSNPVVVSKLNNATAIKQAAFIANVNEITTGLNISVTIINTNEIDRINTTYTIEIVKNGASVTFDVDVDFIR
jgi:hypothetical protein